VFAAGIVLGALVCEALGGRRVELGLVPIGAAGLTFFPLLLVLAGPAPLAGRPLDMSEFLAWREASQVMLAIGFTGFSGGLFVVPLYALVQQRTAAEQCGRVFAANNLFNAAFILAGTLITFLLGWAGLDVAQTITVIAVMNAAVALYIFAQVPEFVMRFIVWILVHTMYRVEKQGLEHIPDAGAAVLVCNHVSYMDALVIMANSPRPVRFVMTHKIFRIPVLSFVFRHAKAIPIASGKEDPDLLGQAYERIAVELEAGQLVCIFPEGHLTADGEMDVFRPGIERIVARTPVPVVPLALKGLWGSFFSRKDTDAVLKLPRRLWSRIGLAASAPVSPGRVSAADLHDRVLAMRGDWL
jgi:1-acyl-sn-glycerol-3-phosphate acyltransferase